MPSTVYNLFSAANLKREGVVQWGTNLPESSSGVYIVSLTESLHDINAVSLKANLSTDAFQKWLRLCPDITLDSVRPDADRLMDRVQRFWLQDEAILYIGRATSLSSRLRQYYRTPIGERAPHSGGYFLKLLLNLSDLWVHYSSCNDPIESEDLMLRDFNENVSEKSRSTLHDQNNAIPFANLEWPQGNRKAHGLRKTHVARSGVVSKDDKQMVTSPRVPKVSQGIPDDYRTQKVTAKDINRGEVRIPSTNTAETKKLFPLDKSEVSLIFRGKRKHCSWDPQMGPDRQRSGVLRVGKSMLRDLVKADEVLEVSRDGADIVIN